MGAIRSNLCMVEGNAMRASGYLLIEAGQSLGDELKLKPKYGVYITLSKLTLVLKPNKCSLHN